MRVAVAPARVTRVLLLAVAILAAAGVSVQIAERGFGHDRLLGLVRLFDLDSEGDVPTGFSSMALLAGAVLLWAIARVEPGAGRGDIPRRIALALVFVGLSVDEAASLHERAPRPSRAAWNRRGIFFFGWVIPGLAVVLALGLGMIDGYVADCCGMGGVSYISLVIVEAVLEMLGIVAFLHALMAHLAGRGATVEFRFTRPR
jgi:hypothetical protein